MSLKETKVVIIGGSSGIGLATAKAAAAERATVIIAGRSRMKLEKAVEEIEGDAVGRHLDVTREGDIRDFFRELGPFDHLVLTAAEGTSGPFLEMEPQTARTLFESKFWGQYLAVRFAAAGIRAGGSITLFAGVASHKPVPGLAAFAAVNGAVEGLCRTLAVELAPIRINVVSPGIIMTPAYAAMPERERLAMYESVAGRLPVKRVGRPEDVARGVLFLMQDGFATGTVLHIDGGHGLV